MDNFLLLAKVLHHLTRHFREHAVLKGGIELALFSSQRSTNDLDFVFVPFSSKKDIVDSIKLCLEQIEGGAEVSASLNSKNVNFLVKQGSQELTVEVSVAASVKSIPMNTAAIAKPLSLIPQIVRVMEPSVALAHKIAAWNERRLLRDLYDIYFWFSVQKVLPDREILDQRLSHIESRLPKLKNRKTMSPEQLCQEMHEYSLSLTQDDIDQELPGLPVSERMHLDATLRTQINLLINELIGKSHNGS